MGTSVNCISMPPPPLEITKVNKVETILMSKYTKYLSSPIEVETKTLLKMLPFEDDFLTPG